jgi:hypothetical protein
MGIAPSRHAQVKTLLIGIKGSRVPVKGALKIPFTIGITPKCISL